MGKMSFLRKDMESKYHTHTYHIWIPHPFLKNIFYIYNPNMVVSNKTIRFPLPN